jgi:hypothetical protein
MSTRKAALVMFSLRIKRFPLRIAMPLRCLAEVTEGFTDLLCLFGKKASAGISVADDALAMLRDYGPLDLVDVDAGSKSEHVKVRLLLR